MNNFDNFDDLIKKKMDGMNFPFNEENWQKAAQMIDASRNVAKKSVLKNVILSLIAASVVFVAGTVIFMQMSDKNTPDTLAENSATDTRPVQQSGKNDDNITSQSLKVSGNIAPENQTSYTAPPTEEGNEITTESRTPKKINTSNKTAFRYSETSSLPSSEAASSKTARPSKPSSASLNEKTSENIIMDLPVGEIENAKQKIKETEPEDKELAPSLAEKPLASDSSEFTVNLSLSKEESAPAIDNNTKSNAAGMQPDTAATGSLGRDYVRMKHHELQAEAGALNSFGWKVGRKRNGNSLTPLAGINYLYHFNSRSAILTGIQYNVISNLTESNVSFSVTSYNFGSNSDVTTFKITELQQLIVPVKYLHTVHKKHSFGIGVNVSYLFNIKNRIENYKVIDGGAGAVSSRNDYGYGFDLCRTINAQAALSYSCRLTDQLSVHAEVNKTLMNVFNDYSVFNQPASGSRPSALKLSLTYSLFRK